MHGDPSQYMLRSALARGVITLDKIFLNAQGPERNNWVWEDEDDEDNDTLIPEHPTRRCWRQKPDGTREEVIYQSGGWGRFGWKPVEPVTKED